MIQKQQQNLRGATGNKITLNTKFTLGDCLFGVVKLDKNADSNKHGHSDFGVGFNAHSNFHY